MWQKLKCLFGYHDFVYIQRLSNYSHRIGCAACHRQWGANTDVRATLPFGLEMADFYRRRGVEFVEWP